MIKNKIKINEEPERFEDVPQELSDKDLQGRYIMKSYMDFYQNVKFYLDKDEQVQPSGMTATNKNYAQ